VNGPAKGPGTRLVKDTRAATVAALPPTANRMEPSTTLISATSRSQAMDWSLVLASQDISCIIRHAAEENQWGLEIAASDHGRASAAIRQYQWENRGWKWRQPLSWPGGTFHWGGLIWCLLLVLLHATATQYPRLASAGVLDSAAVRTGEWWRLFTAMTLHADTGHLVSNITTGLVLFGLAMARYGAGVGLLAAYLAGLGGNLFGLWLYLDPYRGLGASGMVMGALGLVAAQSLAPASARPRPLKIALGGLLGGVMLFLLLGTNPQSDLVAHLGGFGAGCGLGSVLVWTTTAGQPATRVNFSAGLLLAAAVIYTWRLALG
jgi:rhomboid protease GluP